MPTQMKQFKFIIPNTLTLFNLLAGSLAIVSFFEEFYMAGVYLMLVAAMADVLDGLTAKLLQAVSELGKQLDSLADLVSFGLAPSVLMYKMMGQALVEPGETLSLRTVSAMQLILLVLVFFIALFAALRLARFNLDTGKSADFQGMPVPANALTVLSIWLSGSFSTEGLIGMAVKNQYFLAGVVLLLSFLMISHIPMLSFKFKNLRFRGNSWRYALIAGAVFIFVTTGFYGLIYIMVYYILLSVFKSLIDKFRKQPVLG
jgi:CDP-diacylglycerol--serine O-phosphatidyltransferase